MKFVVVVLDKHLRPYQINNLDVIIIDPNGEVVKDFDDFYKNGHEGVSKGNFKLDEAVPFGDWRIRVIVDRLEHLSYSKKFNVRKYEQRLGDLFMKLSKTKVMVNDIINISFGPKYLTSDFVAGDVELVITDLKDSKEIFKENYSNISQIISKTISIENDLKIVTNNTLEFGAAVTFTDTKSQITLQKTESFHVIGEKRFHLKVEHPETFNPGHPFRFLVKFYDWKFDPIVNYYYDDVSVFYTLSMKSGKLENIIQKIGVHKAVVECDVFTPDEAIILNLNVEFINSKPYNVTIERKQINSSSNELIVTASPEV